MKIKKAIKRYCPKCKKHTEQKVTQAKKKAPSSLSYGSKFRARRRGRARGHGNLGRYSKPAISQFKMTGRKQTKKTDLRYECSVCKKTSVQNHGIRAKKVEFV
jgi:large subunit ribosomal protein L44e